MVIRAFHWPWIQDQPRGFYQVPNRHHFLVAIFCYFKPPVTGWFEIKKYSDKKVTTIGNLVETTWLVLYPWPVESTYDHGG